jgi:hypothetical protein
MASWPFQSEGALYYELKIWVAQSHQETLVRKKHSGQILDNKTKDKHDLG